jgi:uncharacterized protein
MPCFTPEILAEYTRVLARPGLGFSPDIIEKLIGMLQLKGDAVRAKPLSGLSPDPDNDKFMACALAAKADFLVTGNISDFPEKQIQPTKVVNAGELLDLIAISI